MGIEMLNPAAAAIGISVETLRELMTMDGQDSGVDRSVDGVS